MSKKNNNSRIQSLLDAILNVADGNYNIQIPLSQEKDIIDGVAIGLNMMIDEIRESSRKTESVNLKYLNLINTIQVGILEVDLFDRIKFVNQIFCDITGYSEKELVGQIAYEVLLEGESKRLMIERVLQRKSKQQSDQSFELLLTKKDNTKIWLSFSSSPIVNSKGEVKGSLGTCQDITDVRRERIYKEISYNIARSVTESNPTIKQLGEEIHNELKQVIDTTSFYICLSDDSSGFLHFPYCADNFDLLQSGNLFVKDNGINEYIIRSGKTLYLRENECEDFIKLNKINSDIKIFGAFIAVPLKFNGRIIGVLAVQSFLNPKPYDDYDIGLLEFVSGQVAGALEKQKAHYDLRISEEIQGSLLNSTSAITLIIQNKKFMYVNPAMERLTGYTIEELHTIDPWSIIDLEYRENMRKWSEERLKGKKVISEYETVMLTKNGDKLFLDITATIIDHKGSKAILATCFNITRRKMAEKELKISELKYRSLIDNMAEGLLCVDNSEIIEFVNERFCTITGYKQEDLIGKVARDLLLKKNSKEYRLMTAVLDDRKSGLTSSMKLPILCKNGEVKWMLNSGTPSYNSDGEVNGSVGILTDISDIVEAAKKLDKERRTALLYQSQLLSAQLSPHFIFNALNSIQYYILNQNTETVIAYVSEFSQLMRKVLTNSLNNRISLEDEINFLKDYLNIETRRIPEKLSYSVKVDNQLDPEDIDIPPMLLQPFVENAIKHGISHLTDSGIIEIYFHKQDGNLLCEILDNGPGRVAASLLKNTKMNGSHKSISSDIINSRISVLNTLESRKYKTCIDDIITNGKIEGTLVKIWVPQS